MYSHLPSNTAPSLSHFLFARFLRDVLSCSPRLAHPGVKWAEPRPEVYVTCFFLFAPLCARSCGRRDVFAFAVQKRTVFGLPPYSRAFRAMCSRFIPTPSARRRVNLNSLDRDTKSQHSNSPALYRQIVGPLPNHALLAKRRSYFKYWSSQSSQ
jgi:hypothetical protein